MKKQTSRALSLLLAFLLTAAALFPAGLGGGRAAAATSNLVVTGYTVLSPGTSKAVSSLTKGQTIDLEVSFKDSAVKTSTLSSVDNLDVTKLVDSFSATTTSAIETAYMKIDSSGDEALAFTVTFHDITYSGSGKTFSYQVGYKNTDISYVTGSLTVTECVEYVATTNTDTSSSDDTTTEPDNPAPVVYITRESMSDPVEAGQSFSVTVYFKNNSKKTYIDGASASFSTSDALMLKGASSSAPLSDIAPGQTVSATVQLVALSEITSESQYLQVDMKYNYRYGSGGNTRAAGTTSEKLPIAAKIKTAVDEAAPNVAVTGYDYGGAALADGALFWFDVDFKNMSADAALENMTMTVETGDGLSIVSSSNVFHYTSLAAGGAQSQRIGMKAGTSTAASSSVTVTFAYDYVIGGKRAQGTSTEKLAVPLAQTASGGGTPVVRVQNYSYGDAALTANTAFDLGFTIQNTSADFNVENMTVTVDASDGVSVCDSSNSFYIANLDKSGTMDCTIGMKALSIEKSLSEPVTVTFAYEYVDGGTRKQATAVEKLMLPVVGTGEDSDSKLASPTPNLIISSYSFGSNSVAAGSTFDLNFAFRNTSTSKNVENIVVTLETGDGLSITSASNSFYYDSLATGNEQAQTINLQALPAAKTGSATIDVNFKYEYVDNKARTQVSSSEKISIPIYQADRFELDNPVLPDYVEQYQEAAISMTYVNKGKSDISNVQAELVGDIDSTAKIQNLGNFESGKSGSINFVVTPEETGDVSFTIRVTYEDANEKTQTKEFPVTLSVSEPMPVDDTGIIDDSMTETKSGPPVKWIAIGAGTGLVALIVVVRLLRRRKRKKAEADIDYDWDGVFEDKPAEKHAEPTAAGSEEKKE